MLYRNYVISLGPLSLFHYFIASLDYWSFAIQQVVAQGDAYTGGAYPAPAVLALPEVLTLHRPFVVIEIIVVGGVHGVLVAIGIVLTTEESELQAQFQFPVTIAAQRHHVACSDAGSNTFAYPTAISIEADAEDGGMGVALQVEAGVGIFVVVNDASFTSLIG